MCGCGSMTVEEDLNEENDVGLYLGEEHRLRAARERETVSEEEGENAGAKDRKDKKCDGEMGEDLFKGAFAGAGSQAEQAHSTQERREADNRHGRKSSDRFALEYPSDTRQHRCTEDSEHAGEKSVLFHARRVACWGILLNESDESTRENGQRWTFL